MGESKFSGTYTDFGGWSQELVWAEIVSSQGGHLKTIQFHWYDQADSSLTHTLISLDSI
jgi:hypothetical protein